jgi:hypothetical protein
MPTTGQHTPQENIARLKSELAEFWHRDVSPEDAYRVEKLSAELERAEHLASLETQPKPEQRDLIATHQAAPAATLRESELQRGARRQRILNPYLKPRALSLNEWANLANVDWHTVADYYNGKTKLRGKTLVALAQVLGLNAEDLPG